jgi:arylsulfatase A-like enzyme
MTHRPIIRRVITVVLDGLRSDAVHALDLHHVRALAARGAFTWTAQTVAPSVTAAAMGSLLTGVRPERHGLTSDRFHIPRSRGPVVPLPRQLTDAGYMTTACMADVPLLYRRIARALARRLGVARPVFSGQGAPEILRAAQPWLASQRSGLVLLHWPDADRAGHEAGWMSPAYAAAARRLDATLGALVSHCDLDGDGSTLLIVMADHGGGGVDPRNHDSAHPLDRTIPLILAGGHAARGRHLGAGVSLLDVPATILWALGITRPAAQEGRVLLEAFAAGESAAA